MEKEISKTAVIILFLVAFIIAGAAIPFALHRKAEVNAAEEQFDVVITIKADIDRKAEFMFQDYKIHYIHDDQYTAPANASVNGIPWPDVEKPFEMGFTPDFSLAKIYEKHGDGDVALSVKDGQFNVNVKVSGNAVAPYQVSVAMKRAPEPPAAATQEPADDGGNADAVPAAD